MNWKLKANIQRGCAALPASETLYYLLQSIHTTSTPYVSFMPVEVMRYGEGNMLEALKRHPPNYIVIIYSSMITYGNIVLGYNYLYNINNWTQKNYQEVWRSTRVNRKDQLYIRVFKSKIIGIKLSK